MRERDYQSKLIKKIKQLYPDCIVMKSDSGYLQGIPDLLILIGPYWFALEVKRSAKAPKQPNQDYYIHKMDEMSFAAFVYPENEEEVLNAIQQSLVLRR